MADSRSMARMMASAFRWGGSMAAVRLACSFLSIKVTAVYLGPAGLALVAQYVSFLSMFQSMLGQGLVTGAVRLSAESDDDPARRRRLLATALWMGLGMTLALSVVLAAGASQIAGWLLTSAQYRWLIAVAGVAIAAAVLVDLMNGALAVSKEIGLVGNAAIVSTLLGLCIFAPACYLWGLNGGLWASFGVLLMSATVSAVVVHRRSRGVRLTDFIGRFDPAECRRIASFYPMLIVNGMLPPLVLIIARDTLASHHTLETAGLWQATWRLSEAYQAVIVTSVSLYFMPSMGERANDPPALRLHVLRSLLAATAATAVLALGIYLLRGPIVQAVFSASFEPVIELLDLQLVGDVLKMSAWILSMALVATMRTASFITNLVLSSLLFVGLTRLLVPGMGIDGVLWAYVCTGCAQTLLGVFALRDVLLPRRVLLSPTDAAPEPAPRPR